MSKNQTVLEKLVELGGPVRANQIKLAGYTEREIAVTLANLKNIGCAASTPAEGVKSREHYYWATPKGQARVKAVGQVAPSAPDAPMAPSVPAAAKPLAQLPSTLAQLEDQLTRLVDQVAQRLVEGVVSRAVAGLQERVTSLVEAEIQAALEPLPERILAALPTPTTPAPTLVAAPPKKKRVTVVGLLNGQVDMMRKEFGKELDLHFVEVAKDSHRLKSLSASSDFVVTVIDFMRHADEKLITAAGGNLVRVSGGMTRLRDKLTEIYVN